MKRRSLWEVPSHVGMLGFAVFFLTSLDLYLEARGRLPVPVLAVNLCLYSIMALASVSLLQAAASESARARIVALYYANRNVLLPLAAMVGASVISAFQPRSYLDEGPRYALFSAYEAVVVFFSMLLPFPAHRRRRFQWYVFAALVVSVASVLTDVLHPGTFSMVTDRAAGFARNPNGAGFLVISLCCGVLSFERVRAVDLAALAATAVAVIATLSRGAFILLAFILACYAASVVRRAWHHGIGTVLMRLAAFGLLIGATVAVVTIMIGQRMFAVSGSRIQMLTGREQVVGPRESRIELLQYSWDLVRDSPIVGYGSGFTFTMNQGPHNIYISRWLDNGLIGLICFLWLLVAVGVTFWKRRHTTGLVFAGVVAIEGFFSHNLLEERALLVLLGTFLTLSFFSAAEWMNEPALADQRSDARRGGRSAGIRAGRPNAKRAPSHAATSRVY